MTTDAIFEKYATALADLGAGTRQLSGDAVLLALRLAVQDAYGAGVETCSGMDDDLAAIVASLQKALQNALDQIDPLREERNRLQAQLSILEEELDGRRNSGAAWVAEIDQLRQQITQMDADNADLTQRLGFREGDLAATRNRMVEALAEADRLKRQNVSATDTHSNGAGVDPTPTQAWNRDHPAWDDLSDEQRVSLYRLQSGDLRFRNLSQDDRRDLVRRVLRHLTEAGEPVTGPEFDRLKPHWMPTAGAVVLLAEGRKWQCLLDLVKAPA